MAGERIATREAYGRALEEFGAKYETLCVLDADLAAATKTSYFKAKYPERFFDCGIQEGNMVGVAAGLSITGHIPFASSFAMFLAGRAFEQVRNLIGYPHLNVKLGATHGGITVGEDGATHQCLEDFATMRSIPGMTVLCPADAVSARAAVEMAIQHDGPFYIRFGRYAVPVLYDAATSFEIGRGAVLRDGGDVTIFANGVMVEQALAAADLLAADGIGAAVIDLWCIKPIDRELVLKYAAKTGCAVTAEEHNIIGGLGSAVCETLAEGLPIPVERVGVRDTFGRSGTVPALMHAYGLEAEHVAQAARRVLDRKNGIS